MSDTGTENSLELDESQPTGTVGLPHCKLVISYQSKGKPQVEKEAPPGLPYRGLPREGLDLPLVISDEEDRSLVDILLDIPTMDKKETRDVLLAELPRNFRESLEPRPEGATADVMHIVARVKNGPRLQYGTLPIETLIEAAKTLAKGTELVDELERHLHKYRKDRPSFGTIPSPLDLKEV